MKIRVGDEKLLNFVDIESGSKVLLSSRVRNVIEGDPSQSSAIVSIELPSVEDSCQMLLSTAGLPAAGKIPAQARELVQFCKLLPFVSRACATFDVVEYF